MGNNIFKDFLMYCVAVLILMIYNIYGERNFRKIVNMLNKIEEQN